ncbi:hypothetical protein HZC53_04305 [Candidatus Uhrbacteria bacterium]|nr:hypothetical protein [Candidatus Uhrbacteria bacterium]
MGTFNWMWLGVGTLVSIAALAACSSPSSDQPGGTGGGGGSGGSDSGATGGGGAGGTGGTDSGPECAVSCDDGFNCTIDACVAGECKHSIGPNTGVTACPAGQYCTADKGCIASPACADVGDCQKAFEGDACKTNIKCDPASSVCLFDILDKDHDGYPPQVCGGDDCDDSAVSVHCGAVEACNGKDDDCDGTADDGASCLDTLQSCQAGVCACKPENLCGTECVDKQTDKDNCGTCGKICSGGMDCVGGQCHCAFAGEVDCLGHCTDTQVDPANCGVCGKVCDQGFQCVAGECVCNTTTCNGKCVDLQTDVENCGSCGKSCDSSVGTCLGGACSANCEAGPFGTACMACWYQQTVQDSCQGAKDACNDDCNSLNLCLGTCTDPACPEGCLEANPNGRYSYFMLGACFQMACSDSCFCPGCSFGDTSECRYCLQTSCASACSQCDSVPECVALRDCRSRCTTDGCRTSCASVFPTAVNILNGVVGTNGCEQTTCAAACQ